MRTVVLVAAVLTSFSASAGGLGGIGYIGATAGEIKQGMNQSAPPQKPATKCTSVPSGGWRFLTCTDTYADGTTRQYRCTVDPQGSINCT